MQAIRTPLRRAGHSAFTDDPWLLEGAPLLIDRSGRQDECGSVCDAAVKLLVMSVSPEHLDVVVVGAGISGISTAYHLQTMCPDEFAILEGGRPRRHLGPFPLSRCPLR